AYQALVFLAQPDQTYTLGVTAQYGNLVSTGTDQGALIGNEHHLIAFKQLQSGHQVSVTVRALHGDDALTTTAVGREFVNGGPLAIAVFTGGEDYAALLRNNQRYHMVATGHLDATYTAGRPAHGPDLLF